MNVWHSSGHEKKVKGSEGLCAVGCCTDLMTTPGSQLTNWNSFYSESHTHWMGRQSNRPNKVENCAQKVLPGVIKGGNCHLSTMKLLFDYDKTDSGLIQVSASSHEDIYRAGLFKADQSHSPKLKSHTLLHMTLNSLM